MSISFTCNNAEDTSFTETPEYLSFIVFVMLFCTIVTYFPAIVKYAELILISASLSASCIDFIISYESKTRIYYPPIPTIIKYIMFNLYNCL